jgi:hypothetical protein
MTAEVICARTTGGSSIRLRIVCFVQYDYEGRQCFSLFIIIILLLLLSMKIQFF